MTDTEWHSVNLPLINTVTKLLDFSFLIIISLLGEMLPLCIDVSFNCQSYISGPFSLAVCLSRIDRALFLKISTKCCTSTNQTKINTKRIRHVQYMSLPPYS